MLMLNRLRASFSSNVDFDPADSPHDIPPPPLRVQASEPTDPILIADDLRLAASLASNEERLVTIPLSSYLSDMILVCDVVLSFNDDLTSLTLASSASRLLGRRLERVAHNSSSSLFFDCIEDKDDLCSFS